jgi:hypothetical protein
LAGLSMAFSSTFFSLGNPSSTLKYRTANWGLVPLIS